MHIKYHCFLSYTTRENELRVLQPFVDHFEGNLISRGVVVAPCLYDRSTLNTSFESLDQLRKSIVTEVSHSVCMISFVNSGYLSSPWGMTEWGTMEGVQFLRGVQRSAVLPIVWNDLMPSERQFLDTMSHLTLTYADDQVLSESLTDRLMSLTPQLVFEVLRFIGDRQKRLERESAITWDPSVIRIARRS